MWKKHFNVCAVICAVVLCSAASNAQQSGSDGGPLLTVNDILEQIKQSGSADNKESVSREQRFSLAYNEARNQYNTFVQRGDELHKENQAMEREFDINRLLIQDLQVNLEKGLGGLQGVFKVIHQAAIQAEENFQTSLVSAQFPERVDRLRSIAEGSERFSSIESFENLWFELQNELVQQTRIVTFNSSVFSEMGTVTEQEPVYMSERRLVTRVGVFNAIANGDNVSYKHGQGLILHPQKLGSAFTARASRLQKNHGGGLTDFWVDPEYGAVVSSLVDRRIMATDTVLQIGRLVGYAIVFVAIIAAIVIGILMFQNFLLGPVHLPQGGQRGWYDQNRFLTVLRKKIRDAKASMERQSTIVVTNNHGLDIKGAIASLQKVLKDSSLSEEKMVQSLHGNLVDLEQFVARDLPFDMEKRMRQIRKVKEYVKREKMSRAQRVHQVLALFSHENEYTHSVNVYPSERIVAEGTKLTVDLLQIGRMQLFCQSDDRKISAKFEQDSREWILLDAKYNPLIRDAIDKISTGVDEDTKKKLSNKLLLLPVSKSAVA